MISEFWNKYFADYRESRLKIINKSSTAYNYKGGVNMPKEEIIKLTEALTSLGYKLKFLDWKDNGPLEPPFGEVIKLEIIKPWPKN